MILRGMLPDSPLAAVASRNDGFGRLAATVVKELADLQLAVEQWPAIDGERRLLFAASASRCGGAAQIGEPSSSTHAAVQEAANVVRISWSAICKAADSKGLTPTAIILEQMENVTPEETYLHAVLPEFDFSAVVAALESEAADAIQAAGEAIAIPRPTTSGATVDERMKTELAANLDQASGLTARQWAKRLNCSSSAVADTPTWQSLQLLRGKAKAEQSLDRRRRGLPTRSSSGPDKTDR